MAESYKGFLITEDTPGEAKAFRNPEFYNLSIPSYTGISSGDLQEQIDGAEDSGDYELEEVALAEIGMNPLNDAMIARLILATKNKVEDVGRTLTQEEIAEVITEVTGWDVKSDEEAVWHAEAFALIEERGAHRAAGDTFSLPEVKRYHGIIVQVGEMSSKTPMLPDWDLSYIGYPPGEMERYRDALMKERVKIRKVTTQRIYFEE